METAYLICAVVGGTIIVCQFLLTLLGLGGDDMDDGGGLDVGHEAGHDAGHHGHGANWLFGVLTFRTVVAGLAFFGLTGLILTRAEFSDGPALAGALAAGLAALFAVSWLMRSLVRLNADGTFRIERAIGADATVYLTVPGKHAGAGKVLVSLHGRRVEFKAVTRHDDLPNGTPVFVVDVVGPDTVEVAPVESSERIPHV